MNLTGAESRAAPLAATVRQLWSNGRRGSALRSALQGWKQLSGNIQDLRWLEETLRGCGLQALAFALQEWLSCVAGTEDRQRTAFIRAVLNTGDPWWARSLLRQVNRSSKEIQALSIEVEIALGSFGDPTPLLSAWVQEYRDAAVIEKAIDWWMRIDRVDEVERLLEATDGPTVWRARLALWRGDVEGARALLNGLAPSEETRCLEAIALVLEGHAAAAEQALRNLTGVARVEGAPWLVTVLLKSGRYAEAVAAADVAASLGPAFNLALWLERMLATQAEFAASKLQNTPPDRLFRATATSPKTDIGSRIEQLEYAELLYPLGMAASDPVGKVELLMQKFAGNHTHNTTIYEDGTLRSYRQPENPGQLGVSIQRVLRTRGIEAVRNLYREFAPRVDEHPRIRLFEGEIELWMGEYETAARIFRAVLERDRTMRWGWIGLGASALLGGELAEAQSIWQQGLAITRTAGPTLYVYRGECFRRQGDLARAESDLLVAIREKPQRLSAWINLALLDGHDELRARIEQKCEALCPFLMEELRGSSAERLEQVLAVMRGNRSSSSVTYHLWGHLWYLRTDTPIEPVPPSALHG